MKILISDSNQGYLTSAWRLGNMTSPRFDSTIFADDWNDVYTFLSSINLPAGVFIEEIQFWAHGQQGKALIGKDTVDLDRLAKCLRGKTNKDTILWWRACSTAEGTKGHEFAQDCVDILNINCIFHCDVISWPNPLLQNEICGLRPGEKPWWSLSGSELPSCSVLRRAPPKWAFKS